MTAATDIVVIGAGIIGAACADELARRGLRVLVLDRGEASSQTTTAGMGHIVVMEDSEAQFALTSYSRKLWHELKADLPATIEFQEAGTVWVAADTDEMTEARRKHEFLRARYIRSELLDDVALRAREPALREGLAGGLLVPDDLIVDPPAVARFLLDRARGQGARVHLSTGVRQVLPNASVELEDGGRLSAGHVLNAAGPWSPLLSPGIPIRKRKGHLAITKDAPHLARSQIVELGYLKSAHRQDEDSVACNVQPRQNGETIIGASRQYSDDDDIDAAIVRKMVERAAWYLPRLASLNVNAMQVRMGHRAATPDNLPLIGPSAASDRIWLASGHEGLGITTALATGRLIADMITNVKPAIPVEPFSPRRFRR